MKDLIEVFISFSYTHELWAVFRTLWPKNMKILYWISSLSCQISPRHWAFKTVNFSLHHSYLNIERFVKTSNRQVSWISLTSRLCKHYLFQWTGHNVASCIGKQYCLGMQRISQFSWYCDAIRIKFNCIYLRSQQVLDTKDTRGILGFKENLTRIQWYVDLIDCAFFSNLFGLTIRITFHNIWCLVKKGMTGGSFHTIDIPKTLLELDPDLCTLYWFLKKIVFKKLLHEIEHCKV